MIKLILSLLAIWGILKEQPSNDGFGNLNIQIENIENKKGMIWIGVYENQESFLDEQQATLIKGFHIDQMMDFKITLANLPFKSYAIALFHDQNNNGKLDQNIFGIPKEPYGFSAKPVSKWRAPSFEEVKFDFQSDQQTLTTALERWSL